MIYGLKGIIFKEEATSIVLNVNNVFYSIKITAPTNKEVGEELFLYTHQVIREDDEYLVGFTSLSEKELFLRLINVSGIGPKTAIGILTATTPTLFEQAINSENLVYLKKLPGVGTRGASQMILDLKGKLQTDGEKGTNQNVSEVSLALSNLGFKKSDINRVLDKYSNSDQSASELLKLALAELRKL